MATLPLSSKRHVWRGGRHAGQLAVIFDKNNKFLAVGLHDPTSPLRVRVLHKGKKGVTVDAAFWRAKVAAAAARRADLNDADSGTTGFRWVNGESDGLPGLCMDRYGDTVVAKASAHRLFSTSRVSWRETKGTLAGGRTVVHCAGPRCVLCRDIQPRCANFAEGDEKLSHALGFFFR